MQILVVAATTLEIKPFLADLKNGQQTVSVLITGPGLIATTYALTKQFSLFKPDLVIQAGIAGSFDPAFPPGSLVAVKSDLAADEGVMENDGWKTIADLGFRKPNQSPFQGGRLLNKSGGLQFTKLKKVNAVSVNSITSSRKTIALYKEKFNPVAESMEGAAFHYVCNREKIPYLQIRAISNFTGERNKSKWNLKDSIRNLNNHLIELLDTL